MGAPTCNFSSLRAEKVLSPTLVPQKHRKLVNWDTAKNQRKPSSIKVCMVDLYFFSLVSTHTKNRKVPPQQLCEVYRAQVFGSFTISRCTGLTRERRKMGITFSHLRLGVFAFHQRREVFVVVTLRVPRPLVFLSFFLSVENVKSVFQR